MSSSLGEIVKDVLDKNGLLHLLAIFRSWIDDAKSSLNNRIDSVSNNLDNNSNTLQSAIDDLSSSFQTKLDDEKKTLQTNINNVADSLNSTKTTLQTNIDNLTGLLNDTKTTLQTNIDNVASNLAATANTLQTNINNLATRVTNVENKLKPPSNANNKFVLTANGNGGTTWRQLTATDVTNVVSTSGGTITGNLNVVGNLTQNGLPISTKIFQAGTTAPSNKDLLWIDTNTNGGLKYYNGSAWVLVPVGYT